MSREEGSREETDLRAARIAGKYALAAARILGKYTVAAARIAGLCAVVAAIIGVIGVVIAPFIPRFGCNGPIPGCKPLARLAMSRVEKGGHTVPWFLREWTHAAGTCVVIDRSFHIMRREITVGDYRLVRAALETEIAVGELRPWPAGEAQLQAAGDDDAPLAGIPFRYAIFIADQFSRQTGCQYRLPSYAQWQAALGKYGDAEKVLRPASIASGPGAIDMMTVPFEGFPMRRSEQPRSVMDLIGNLREWSCEPCEAGHLVLGLDYRTFRQNANSEPICMSHNPDETTGMRLVMEDKE